MNKFAIIAFITILSIAQCANRCYISECGCPVDGEAGVAFAKNTPTWCRVDFNYMTGWCSLTDGNCK
jgi:hypothetical protein